MESSEKGRFKDFIVQHGNGHITINPAALVGYKAAGGRGKGEEENGVGGERNIVGGGLDATALNDLRMAYFFESGVKITLLGSRKWDHLKAVLLHIFTGDRSALDKLAETTRIFGIVKDELGNMHAARREFLRKVEDISKLPTREHPAYSDAEDLRSAEEQILVEEHPRQESSDKTSPENRDFSWYVKNTLYEHRYFLTHTNRKILEEDGLAAAAHFGLNPSFDGIFQGSEKNARPLEETYEIKLHISLSAESYGDIQHRREIHKLLNMAQDAGDIGGFKYTLPFKVEQYGERAARFKDGDQFTIYFSKNPKGRRIAYWLGKIESYCKENKLSRGATGGASLTLGGFINVRQEYTNEDRKVLLRARKEERDLGIKVSATEDRYDNVYRVSGGQLGEMTNEEQGKVETVRTEIAGNSLYKHLLKRFPPNQPDRPVVSAAVV